MSKLEQLTPKQESLIPIIRDKWINKLNKPEPFDKDKAKKAVEWLYEFSGLSKPEVLFFESPLGVQIGLNMLKNTGDSVGASVGDSVRASVWASVWASVRASVEDSVWDSVWDSVGDSVWDSVGASVWASVWDSVRASKKLQYYSTCNYGDCSDFSWTAFYDYFDLIAVLDHEKFRAWRDYCEAGIFYCVQLDGICAVCPMPKYVKRNNTQAMHCEDGFAIEWADGFGIYVLDGIRFDRREQDKLYWKIVKHELTLPEILAIEDIDQRAVALKYCNAESVIQSLVDLGQAKLIDTANKQASYLEHNSIEFIDGVAQIDFLVEKPTEIQKTLKYKLYKVNIPNILENEYMLVYPHASVEGLSYWKGVEPSIAKNGSIAAIAHYHNMSVDEYLLATSQS